MVELKLLLPAHQEHADISARQVLIGPLTTLLHFYLIRLSNRRSYGQTELLEKLLLCSLKKKKEEKKGDTAFFISSPFFYH